MKNIQFYFSNFNTISLAILCSFLFISCVGQVERNVSLMKFKTVKTKIHQDSISMKAETLPEFKVDIHDTD